MAPSVSSAGPEAIERASSVGLDLDPWQRDVLVDALGERADGSWASYEVGLCCPRQNGKSAVLEALMLWSLFCDPEAELTIYTAHEFKTTREIFRRIDGLIGGSDELRPLIRRRVSTLVEMGFETFDGSRLLFLARSGSSGRGFSCDRPIFDEAMILPVEAMLAMLPMLSARPNPQAWFTGSAGMATSDYWRTVCNRGRAGTSPRLTWVEYAAPDDADPDDRQAWAQANPGYPVRLSDDAISAELDAVRTSPATLDGWKRERLGHWDDPETGAAVIDPQTWTAHAEPDQRITGRPVFALDVSPLRTSSAIAVAGDCGGRPLVEIPGGELGVDHRPGVGWLVPRVLELCNRYGSQTVYLTGTASESLRPELELGGLVVEALSAPQLAQACGAFFDAATAPTGQGLVHSGQPDLAESLAVARRAETDHGWQWGRRKSAGDITPLVAATVALWGLAQARPIDPSIYFI